MVDGHACCVMKARFQEAVAQLQVGTNLLKMLGQFPLTRRYMLCGASRKII